MTPEREEHLLSIQEASRRLKVPTHTLRFWERAFEGILAPLRTKGGQRRYTPEDVSMIERIKRLRGRGLALAEVKRKLGESHTCRDLHSKRVERLASQVAEVVKAEVYDLLKREVQIGSLVSDAGRSTVESKMQISETGAESEESP